MCGVSVNSPDIYYLKRFFVRKENLIDASILSSNENCCVNEKKNVHIPITKVKSIVQIKEKITTEPEEIIVEVSKQTAISKTLSDAKSTLFDEILNNSWSRSNELVENVMITRKRCYFSSEALSIKPITASLFIRTFLCSECPFVFSTGNR